MRMGCYDTWLLALVAMVVVASAWCDDSKEREECAESVVGLATCLPYIGGGGSSTANSPTPDCCTALKQVLNTNKKCVCVLIKDRNDPDLGLNINLTLALSLPQACNAPANISQCPSLLKLPPDSPDAQVFYQLGHNSSTSASDDSDRAGVSGTSTGSISVEQQESDGCSIDKSFIGLKIFGGFLILWSLTSSFAI